MHHLSTYLARVQSRQPCCDVLGTVLANSCTEWDQELAKHSIRLRPEGHTSKPALLGS